MALLRFLPIFCLLLFALTRKINIRVTKSDELTVKINFNIVALVLTEAKIKKRWINKLPNLIKNVKGALKPLKYLVSKSEVLIISCINSNPESRRFPVIYSACFYASTQFIISYLQKNARSLRFASNTNPKSDYEKASLDISFCFPLYHLIISALLFLYYTLKYKIKRVLKNG